MPRSSETPGRSPEDIPAQRPPAQGRERRTQQLVTLAENLIEERLRMGTASPTEVVSIIRLGTAQEQANIERIRAQTEYLRAQKAKAEGETFREEIMQKAIQAMNHYNGDD